MTVDFMESGLISLMKKSSCGRRGGLMVSELNSGSGGLGSSPGRGTALCSWARHFWCSLSLHPGVQIGTGEFTAGGNPAMN